MSGLGSRAIAVVGSILLVIACGGKDEAPFAVGTLERDRVELRAETDDPIVEIAAREGTDLAAGALVLRLDDARLAAQRERAVARRDEARARLAELVRGPRQERLAEARARLEGDETRWPSRSASSSGRATSRAAACTPRSASTNAVASYDAAVARRDEDRAALAALSNGTTREELDQGRSALAAAEAELADIEVRVGRLAVTAPVAGRLDALPYELGERPRAGDVVAIMLADGAPYARVYVPEPLLVAARQGAAAEVVADGDPRIFRGRVRRLSSEATFTPHYALTERDRGRLSYLAEIELDDPTARELPTGVPVEARFPAAAVAGKQR